MVPAECLHILAKAYVDPSDYNNYSEPYRADAAWWRNLPVQSTLNVYGGYECLRDGIIHVGKMLEEAGNNVKNVECAKEVHIDCILDAMAGFEPGEMSRTIWEWLASIV